MSPNTRPNVASLEVYEGGRSPELVRAELGLSGPLVELGANERPFPPDDFVLAAVYEAARQGHRYPDYTAKELRRALVGHLAEEEARWNRRCEVAEEQIVVGCGSSSLIQQLFLCYVSEGDEIVVPWPSYRPLLHNAQLCGAEVVRVGLVDETADLPAMLRAITPRTKVICLTNPNNPTSTAVERASVTAFLEQVPSDIVVLVDEAYVEYSAGELYGSAVHDLVHFGNLVVARTFSKTFGLAGFRVGFAVSNPAIVNDLRRVGFAFPVGNCAQAAALATVRSPQVLEAHLQRVLEERERVTRELRQLGWRVADSRTNFIWLPLGAPGASSDLARRLEAVGVVTRAFAEGLRVTIGTREENDVLLARLSELGPSLSSASRVESTLRS